MRLKLIAITSIFFLLLLWARGQVLAACGDTVYGECSGYCGTQIINFSHTTTYPASVCADQGLCSTQICHDSYSGQECVDPTNPNNVYPAPGVCCEETICSDCYTSPANCIYETANVLCNCEPTVTPTIDPSPTVDTGTPPPTGTVTPPPTTTPTPPTTALIQGSIQTDVNAALSGAYCNQATTSPLTVAGWNLSATGTTGTLTPSFQFINTNNYSFNTTTSGGIYTVTLDLSGQTGGFDYVCSCPAAADPNNPYLCRYTGVGSPTANVNFYLRQYNLTNLSWFQIFGGNTFGRGGVASPVPYDFCSLDANCQAALAAPQAGSSNPSSSGFLISNTNSINNLRSSNTESLYHAYFHLASRPSNLNSYIINSDLNQPTFNYFYNLAKSATQEIGDGTDSSPLLGDWVGAAWWNPAEVNYVRVDGNVNIDESQGFNLASGQQLVVFVDGNLTVDDGNPNDANRKIISVANGGFLAFIVSGNILVTADVGYELNPLAPSVPAASTANSNLEGIFMADGSLTIQAKAAVGGTPPDKKFIGAGTFVGWQAVNLDRTFEDGGFGPILNNNQAIENFVYRIDLLANWPTKLKTSLSNWREVDPQLIGQ
jgi:hypothetical protein